MKSNLKRSAVALLVCAIMLACSMTAYAVSYDHFTPLPEDSGVIVFIGNGASTENNSINSEANQAPGGSYANSDDNNRSGDFNYTLEEFAALHLLEVNRIRAEYGVPELLSDPVLTEMAMQRAAEYSPGHKRADGSEWYTIFDEYDSGLRPTGENMSAAGGSPESSARGFLTSAGHSANLLNPDAEYIGVGVVWVDTVIGPRIAVIELFAH